MTPRIDVIIPTWNKRELVLAALATLSRQTVPHSVYVVDNGSVDGTVAAITEAYPGVTVIALPENRGFARAVNEGIRAGDGDLVVVLNNDVEAAPDFVEELAAAFADASVGSVAGILLTDDGDAIDAAGIVIDASLAGYSHLHARGLDALENSPAAFAPCGGAAGYRRTVLEKIGLFDEEIFAYSEDVDLGLRLAAAGVPTATAWSARVRHRGSATLGHRSVQQLRLSSWARGYLLGRYRLGIGVLTLELAIGVADALSNRSALPLSRRLNGFARGRQLPARPRPTHAELTVWQGLRLRHRSFRSAPIRQRMRVAVENGHERDLAGWRRDHARGLKPDASPYGLDRMASASLEVTILGQDGQPEGVLAGLLTWVLRRLRVDPVVLVRPHLRGYDVVVTEHEKHSVPLLLLARFLRTPKIVTGVVWLTDETAGLPGPLQRLLQAALKQAAAVVVHSSGQLDVLRRWGIEDDRLVLAPFGVDADFWAPAAAETVEPDLIVSAGSDRDRDYPTLIAALSILRQQRQVRLHLAGDVPCGPADGLSLLGNLSHADLRELYASAALVVVPTRDNVHCSGLTSTLETMMMGRPLVVTDTPGMRDYVEDGVNGSLVPPGDPAALAAAIGRLLDDRPAAEAMGRTAAARAAAEFTTERFAATIAEVARRVARTSTMERPAG